MAMIACLPLQAGNAALSLRNVGPFGKLRLVSIERNDRPGRKGISPGFVVNRPNSLLRFGDTTSIWKCFQVSLERLDRTHVRSVRPRLVLRARIRRRKGGEQGG